MSRQRSSPSDTGNKPFDPAPLGSPKNASIAWSSNSLGVSFASSSTLSRARSTLLSGSAWLDRFADLDLRTFDGKPTEPSHDVSTSAVLLLVFDTARQCGLNAEEGGHRSGVN